MARRSPVRCLAVTAASIAAAALSAAREAPERRPAARAEAAAQSQVIAPGESLAREGPEDARARRAARRGLDWLAAEQEKHPDGSFPSAGAQHYVPVPLAALAALAFMAGGSTPERGPHGRPVARAIDYLLERADLAAASPARGFIASEGDAQSRMHGHGFAALALSQAYAVSPRTTRGQRTAQVLEAAVRLIETSQGLEGGWYYEPRRSYEHENSVTVCLVQALRAAHGAGIAVDQKTVERAVDYVRRCQAEDGTFRYGLSSPTTSVALTAAGIATLNSLGRYESSEVERAMDALGRRLGGRESAGQETESRFPFYERLYLAQALWQYRDVRPFERWYEDERARVLARQLGDGSWEDRDYGACFATAVNCLFLTIRDGALPIFQR